MLGLSADPAGLAGAQANVGDPFVLQVEGGQQMQPVQEQMVVHGKTFGNQRRNSNVGRHFRRTCRLCD